MPSCRPENLDAFAEVATSAVTRAEGDVTDLAAALDGFRATDGWDEFIGDVPPVDIDAGVMVGMVSTVATWTSSVAAAFRLLDRSPIDGVHSTGDLMERLFVPAAPIDEGAALVHDGDRWILVGTDQADHVRLVRQDDGSYVAEVGQYDPVAEEIVYRSIPITADQARHLTIRVGAGDDVVEIPHDQRLHITTWTGDGDDFVGDTSANPLVAVGGGGNERIFLGDGDDIAHGGAGDDEIHGGAGDDVIDCQDGDDRLLGGDGADAIHGGRGDDRIFGGRGDDMLEGGSGSDHLEGGLGDDLLSGGRGDDTLLGQQGDDVLMGGRGDDVHDGGLGDDRIVKERGESARGGETVITLELTGDPGSYAIEIVQPDWMTDAEFAAWEERIDSDLELLRTTESGRVGLEALDAAAHDSDNSWNPWDRDRVVQIVPYGDHTGVFTFDPDGTGPEPERAYRTSDWLTGYTDPQPSYSSPPGNRLEHDVLVNYAHNRAGIGSNPQPAASILHHELAHAYDQISGGTPGGTYEEHHVDADGNPVLGMRVDTTGDGRPDTFDPDAPRVHEYRRAELNAVGFDLDGDGEIDTYDSRGGRPHPVELTENALLGELGYDLRPSYGPRPGSGEAIRFESHDR